MRDDIAWLDLPRRRVPARAYASGKIAITAKHKITITAKQEFRIVLAT